jgi:hypothetical protein
MSGQRLGMLMEPEPSNSQEVAGGLSPVSARSRRADSTIYFGD